MAGRNRAALAAVLGSLIVVAGAELGSVVSSRADQRARPGVVAKRLSAAAGIKEIARTYRATAGDLNGDRFQDLVVVRHWEAFPRVYINQGDGTFVDISQSHFPRDRPLRRDRHDCPIGDPNGDGLADIYCTIGGKKGGTGATPNELWLQRDNGRFVSSRGSGFRVGAARNRYGRGRDARFLDANRDGHLDLYVLNAFPRKDGRSGKSRLYINDRGRRYISASKRGFTGPNREVGGRSLQAVDYDGDGRDDLLVCGKKGIQLFRNIRGRNFRNVTAHRRIRMSCVDARLARIDRSGRLGLIRLSERALTVHRQFRSGKFSRPIHSRRVRGGNAIAVGDATGDRLADVYAQRRGAFNRDKRDLMLLNRRSGKNFVRVGIPQRSRGRGDAVTAIDHDRNGLSDFIVMNGHRKARGPVDLIAFFRR